MHKTGFFDRIKDLLRPKSFNEIRIKKEVVRDIIDFSRENYPNEFVAILEGKLEKNALLITGLFYQPFSASEDSTSMQMNLPMISGAVGSVHSHPSGDAHPSATDIASFGKNGFVHMIIGYPYTEKEIKCYNMYGVNVNCSIIV